MGGIGGRGGPGEKQIELDRRMIDESIKRTKERLQKVKKQRATQRRRRERHGIFNISLVGYTNAGKSTLFNALDRKSTRLNSSHLVISYAVFCLKKKNTHVPTQETANGMNHPA